MSVGSVVVAAPALGAGGGSVIPDAGVAIGADPTQARAEIDLAAAAGVPWVSFGAAWTDLEPVPGSLPTSPPWTELAGKFAHAKARGLRVLVTFANAPDWASGRAGASNDPPTPANLPRYGAFLRRFAATLGPLVDAYSPWNEPNTTYSWAPVNAVAYARLQRMAYRAIKSADPTALVLSGPIVGRASAYRYLTDVYRAGLRGYVDVLAWNAYPSGGPEGTGGGRGTRSPASLQGQFHVSSLVRRLDPGRPIWITEMSWSTCVPSCDVFDYNAAGLARQAEYLLRMFTFRRRYLTGITERIFWYRMRDDLDRTRWNQNQGLVRFDFAPKPAYLALAKLRVAARGARGLGARSGVVAVPRLPAAARQGSRPVARAHGGAYVALGSPRTRARAGAIEVTVDVWIRGGRTRLVTDGYVNGVWRRVSRTAISGSSRVRIWLPDRGYLGLRLRASAPGRDEAIAQRIAVLQ